MPKICAARWSFLFKQSDIHNFKKQWDATWRPRVEENHVCWENLQHIKRWSRVSSSSKQRGQIVSISIPFLRNLLLVGRMSFANLQRKFWTLGGAFILQIAFQSSWSFEEEASWHSFEEVSLVRRWADLTEYLPFFSQCHILLSSGNLQDNGIFRICFASKGENTFLIRSLFQLFVSVSISSLTRASEAKTTGGLQILKLAWFGNQLSFQIFTFWPLMSKTASARFYRSSKNRVSFRQGVMNLINF